MGYLVFGLNQAGLLLGIIGAFLIWKHGLPPADIETEGILLEGSPDLEEIAQMKDRHLKWSRAGMLMIAIGFVFQFASNLMTRF